MTFSGVDMPRHGAGSSSCVYDVIVVVFSLDDLLLEPLGEEFDESPHT